MKKLRFIILSLSTAILLFSCGGKYSDYEKVMESSVVQSEDFSKDLMTAGETGDGKAVAKVINDFIQDENMLKETEKFQKVAEKYPEIKLDDPTTFPEEWESLPEQIERMDKAMGDMIGVLINYAQDPDVVEALNAFAALEDKPVK